ncbi:MAG: hypothetical protein J2P37_14845 [Ktedonobacteraceae bacterium]|nr:hypothetical protein [Ktedonobacteraceae bacterium]
MARTARDSANETIDAIDQATNSRSRKRGKSWLILPLIIVGALAIASFTILRRNARNDEED